MAAEIRSDLNLFKNAKKLRQEGALLLEAAEHVNTTGGRVVFSLQEIPLKRRFQTVNGSFLRRDKSDQIRFFTPDNAISITLDISTNVTSANKDHLLWAQSQNDLLLFDDCKQLGETGATVYEQVSGTEMEIHSLSDLPLGVKFFTTHASIIQRISENEVVLCDKTLYIQSESESGRSSYETSGEEDLFTPYGGFYETTKGDSSDSSDSEGSSEDLSDNSDSETTQGGPITLGEGGSSGFTPTPIPTITKAPTVAGEAGSSGSTPNSSENLSPQFPRAGKAKITGSGSHTDAVRFFYTYFGGVEGNSIIRWELYSPETKAFVPIKGQNSTCYRPSMEDIGCTLRVAYTPVRADGVTGAVVFSNSIEIYMDPEIRAEVESNLALSTLVFKVLMSNGNEFQKRTIALTKQKIKIRKRRATVAKARNTSLVKAICDPKNDCIFTLHLGPEVMFNFIAPSVYQRDIIVLTMASYGR